MTKKTRERLMQRLKKLKAVERQKVAREIGTAREMGDLRENAEYEAAKHKQELIMAEVRNLETKLSESQIIEELPITGEIVSIGTMVEFEDLGEGKCEQYTILGADDTDVENNRISYLSPLAKGLIGKSPGQEVVIALPESTRSVRIISIKKFNV